MKTTFLSDIRVETFIANFNNKNLVLYFHLFMNLKKKKQIAYNNLLLKVNTGNDSSQISFHCFV